MAKLVSFINQCDKILIMLMILTLSSQEDLMLSPGSAPTEPLLCKFADGGQKKRQSQGKYLQNGRSWTRDSESVSSFMFGLFFSINTPIIFHVVVTYL